MAYSIGVTASRVGRQSGRRWVRRAGRALLRALQESRSQAARKIIHDYRHLLEGETAMSRRATLAGREP
ncbi:MAG TPA: hypothetical protein VII39_11030 [Bradyrhizobium sp.]